MTTVPLGAWTLTLDEPLYEQLMGHLFPGGVGGGQRLGRGRGMRAVKLHRQGRELQRSLRAGLRGRWHLGCGQQHFPGAGFALGQVRSDGHIGDLGAMRGEGGRAPAIASGPQGSVICAGQIGFARLADGSQAPTPLSNARAFDGALGEPFFGGDGVAVGPSGQIYADTSPLANHTPYAIGELFPSGRAHVIWKS